MNHDQFRSEEGLRVELATFLRSPVGLIVVSILRELGRPRDVPSGTDALASARVLSQYHGYSAAIDDLERLAVPAGKGFGPLPEPEWGSDQDLGDQLPLQTDAIKMKEVLDARNSTRNATADAAAARIAARAADDAAREQS